MPSHEIADGEGDRQIGDHHVWHPLSVMYLAVLGACLSYGENNSFDHFLSLVNSVVLGRGRGEASHERVEVAKLGTF